MKEINTFSTIAGCGLFTFANILAIYAINGGNPANRIGYAVFISAAPIVAAIGLNKLRKVQWTTRRAAEVYFLLLLTTMVVQQYGRTVSVNRVFQNIMN